MTSKLALDPRIDPRIKTVFGAIDFPVSEKIGSREKLLELEQSEAVRAGAVAWTEFVDSMGHEAVAPDAGLSIRTERFTSHPANNIVNIQFIRPNTEELLACVYYIHGGGMAQASCYDSNYKAWGRMIARGNVAVAMVDFRNSVRPSSAPEVEPFPAGLNDCVSGLKWVHENAAFLGIDPEHIIVAGDSGGGNLTIATALKLLKDGDIRLLKGIYAMCPFIGGMWPIPECPSSIENEGIFLSLHNNDFFTVGYGMKAYQDRNPLAWPVFAQADDVKGLPPVVISVNECDPLRDEGINFYRLLMQNGVSARCRQIMGTIHATEIFPAVCPDISRSTAEDIAGFAKF